MAMTWGHTFMLHEGDRSFQGIYVGAGPYLAAQAYADFDAEFEKLLNSETDRYVRSASMGIGGGETDQLALDITGSYRARFPSSHRTALVPAAMACMSWRITITCRGFASTSSMRQLRLDTDPGGLLVPNPPETPFTLEWHTSSKGIGLALDFGMAFVVNRWDFGAGVSGVANRIKWRDITRHELALVSLFNGTEFVHVKLPRTNLTTQIELPVTYTGDLSYHRDAWSAYTEYRTV